MCSPKNWKKELFKIKETSFGIMFNRRRFLLRGSLSARFLYFDSPTRHDPDKCRMILKLLWINKNDQLSSYISYCYWTTIMQVALFFSTWNVFLLFRRIMFSPFLLISVVYYFKCRSGYVGRSCLCLIVSINQHNTAYIERRCIVQHGDIGSSFCHWPAFGW